MRVLRLLMIVGLTVVATVLVMRVVMPPAGQEPAAGGPSGSGAAQQAATATPAAVPSVPPVTPTAQPTLPAPTPLLPTATLPPPPTPTPVPEPGTVLYEEANWSGGLGGWLGSDDWKAVSGLLVNDGSQGNPFNWWITAPYQPTTANYAIEVEVQLLNPGCGATYKMFGLVARATNRGGVLAGFECGGRGPEMVVQTDRSHFYFFQPTHTRQFNPKQEWHTYRLEVYGNTIRLLVGDVVVLELADNRHLSPGKVGLFSVGAQISVRSFKVVAL